ncbi:hypothetical protein AVEN_251662-1 [Araneus ventricosus]|uniref:Uncharacterized protein n=1 Tax=Araneus ventricosus TaxID=182803 RepID=A0A4Y2Q6K9_ARAVE|nr:hypothetical protein AVEN_186817-1 [Araneus ventricosus]GBN58258.1 hypothetical protein AVEN_251662-1 [Araneus ventricosus]
MRVRRSSKLFGSGDIYTLFFTNPHKKKSHGVMSGDLGVKETPLCRLFRRGQFTILRNSRTSSVEEHHPAERRNYSSLPVIAGKGRSVTYKDIMCCHSLSLP